MACTHSCVLRPVVRSSGLIALALCAGGLGALVMQAPTSVAQSPAPVVAPRLATVDIFTVVERVWLGDAYIGARTALAETTNKELQALNDSMTQMRAQAQTLQPDSAELRALSEQFAKLQEEAQTKQRTGADEMERLSTIQLGEAYQTVMKEAQSLASQLGYSHVIASKTGELQIRSTTMNGALQELLARPMVVAAASDDITLRLLEKFPPPTPITDSTPVGDAGTSPQTSPQPAPVAVPPQPPATTPR